MMSFNWPYVISYWCRIRTESLSSAVFEIFGLQKQKHGQTHAASDFIVYPMQCIALDRQKATGQLVDRKASIYHKTHQLVSTP